MFTKKLHVLLFSVVLCGSLAGMNLDTTVLKGSEVRIGTSFVALAGVALTFTSFHYCDDIKLPVLCAAGSTVATYATFRYLDCFSVKNQFAYLENQIQQLQKNPIIEDKDKKLKTAYANYKQSQRDNDKLEIRENNFLSKLLNIMSPCIPLNNDSRVIHKLESYCNKLITLIGKEEDRLKNIRKKNRQETWTQQVNTENVSSSLLLIKNKILQLLHTIQSLYDYNSLTNLKLNEDYNKITEAKQKYNHWNIILLPLTTFFSILPCLLQYINQITS